CQAVHGDSLSHITGWNKGTGAKGLQTDLGNVGDQGVVGEGFALVNVGSGIEADGVFDVCDDVGADTFYGAHVEGQNIGRHLVATGYCLQRDDYLNQWWNCFNWFSTVYTVWGRCPIFTIGDGRCWLVLL